METWYAIVADVNITKDNKREYDKGEVVSYGSVIPSAEELAANGLRAIPIGDFGPSGPNFRSLEWDPRQERLKVRLVPDQEDQ